MAQNKMSNASKKSNKLKNKKSTMEITSRIVDVRRHTLGYVAGGKKYSVAQIKQLAATGRVRGVQVVGNHIQSLPGGARLTDLPMKIVK